MNLNFSIDLEDRAKLSAFAKLFEELAGQTPAQPVKPVDKPVEKPEKTPAKASVVKAETVKAKTVDAKVVDTKAAQPEEPAAPVEPTAEPAAEPKYTVEQVRAKLALKVDAHRTACKDKLKALGAVSVSKLDPSKFEDFWNFLDQLS